MKKIISIIVAVIGILIIVGLVYNVFKFFGFVWGVLIIVAVVGTTYMNEHHNPINLYYRNFGKKKDQK